jgi:hypothetical protein
MCTKPRTELGPAPIVAKLAAQPKPQPIEITAKYPPPRNSFEKAPRNARATQPQVRCGRYDGGRPIDASPISLSRGVAHTESYLAPFALARPSTASFVPSSLAL